MLGYISLSGAPDQALRGVNGELVCKHKRAGLLYKALQEDCESPREAAHFTDYIWALGTKFHACKLLGESRPRQRHTSSATPPPLRRHFPLIHSSSTKIPQLNDASRSAGLNIDRRRQRQMVHEHVSPDSSATLTCTAEETFTFKDTNAVTDSPSPQLH